MTRRTSRARRHLYHIERRLDVLEQRIRALEDLRSVLPRRSRSPVPSSARIEVLQEVGL